LTKEICKHGNSLALVIDRPILELLGIDEQTTLNISTDGRALIIVPSHGKRRSKRFLKALEDGNEQYGGALKRPAE
jgi:antitoxin component of MazEF toxin-antitoxin module